MSSIPRAFLSPVTWCYFLLLFVGLMLPSDGNHGVFSPKSLVFLGSVCSGALALFLKRELSQKTLSLFYFFLAFSLFSLFFLAIGISSDQKEIFVIDQFKLFVITISVILLTLFYIFEGILKASTILKSIIYFNFFYSFTKITLVTLHLLKIINIWKVLDFLGLRYMSMAIIGDLGRLQTSVDVATPFLMFFVLSSSLFQLNFSKKFKFFYIVISLLSIFLSFSRFFIFIGIFSFGLYALTLDFSKKIKLSLLFFFIALSGTVTIGFDTTYTIIEKRFFSKDSKISDKTRKEQIKALLKEAEEYPYVGKGFGGYAKASKRDNLLPYSYEVQWVSFVLQFGLLGILSLLFFLSLIFFQILQCPHRKSREPLLLLFILWLLAGFTNPFLVSLTSGILYSLFLLPTYIPVKSSPNLVK